MDVFWLKVLLSFLVGGSYIAFTIWVSERFGSKIGGVLIGLPSTSLASLAFIAWSQGVPAAVSTVPVIPAVFGASCLFVAVFFLLQKKGVGNAFPIAFCMWFAITLSFVFLKLEDLALSVGTGILLSVAAIIVLSRFPHRRLQDVHSPKMEFLFRSAFAGGVVAFAVLVAKFAGPLWGGVFAAFPAAFSSSIFLLSKKHGAEFAGSVARTMPYGSMSTVAFVLAFYFSAPALGLVGSLAFSLAASLAAAAALYWLFLK